MVEDDGDYAYLWTLAFEGARREDVAFEVVVCGTLGEAVRALCTNADFDFALIDIQLPLGSFDYGVTDSHELACAMAGEIPFWRMTSFAEGQDNTPEWATGGRIYRKGLPEVQLVGEIEAYIVG